MAFFFVMEILYVRAFVDFFIEFFFGLSRFQKVKSVFSHISHKKRRQKINPFSTKENKSKKYFVSQYRVLTVTES